jgi:hypothetical protein
LERIERRALSDCSSLHSISLPSSVKIIGWACFSDCKSLSSLTFE